MLTTVLIILLVLAALATVAMLIMGVVNMAQRTDISGQRSQELMRKRILFQGIAILLVIALLVVAGSGR